MTSVVETQREEGRGPSSAIVILGAVVVLSFLMGVTVAPLLFWSSAPEVPVLFIGVNGTFAYFVDAPPGSFVYTPVKLCNVAESDVVAAVSVEAPWEVRIFAIHVGDVWFGRRWGELETLTIRLASGQCVDGRLEILIDGMTPPDRQIIVKIESRVD